MSSSVGFDPAGECTLRPLSATCVKATDRPVGTLSGFQIDRGDTSAKPPGFDLVLSLWQNSPLTAYSAMRGSLGLVLSAADRVRLAAIIADRSGLQKQVWRARVVPLTGDRVGTARSMRRTELDKVSIWRCQERSIDSAVDCLLRNQTRPSRCRRPSSAPSNSAPEALRLGSRSQRDHRPSQTRISTAGDSPIGYAALACPRPAD
jgi:hypothetical protein